MSWLIHGQAPTSRPGQERHPSGPSLQADALSGEVIGLLAAVPSAERMPPGRSGVALRPCRLRPPLPRLCAKGDRDSPDGEDDDGARARSARYGAARTPGRTRTGVASGERPAPANGQTVPPRRGREARASRPKELDPDAQPYADEAHEARTFAALKDVNASAREAHKLASLITNPSTRGRVASASTSAGAASNWRKSSPHSGR